MSSASCASSSSTNTAITKGEKMLVSKVIEKAVKTVQSTEAEKTLQPTMASKILKDNEVVKTLEATEPVKTMKDSDAPSHSYLSSSPIGLVQEQEVTPEQTGNVVPEEEVVQWMADDEDLSSSTHTFE